MSHVANPMVMMIYMNDDPARLGTLPLSGPTSVRTATPTTTFAAISVPGSSNA